MSITYAQKQVPAQKKEAPGADSIHDSSLQGEALQRKADLVSGIVQRIETPHPNNTGMPDNLKSGIESLSGYSMDNVRVHYNSSKPATVQALAYTQGTDIHVAPGQEKHLPHEAWHVAQQMAGRVAPTTNINGMPVNDNAALEHEADVMGEKAVTQRKSIKISNKTNTKEKIIQRQVPSLDKTETLPALYANGKKPEPNCHYRPQEHTKNDYYWDDSNRDHFQFNDATRMEVDKLFLKEEPEYAFMTGSKYAVMTGSGYAIDSRGKHIDHSPVSWKNMNIAMEKNNSDAEKAIIATRSSINIDQLAQNHVAIRNAINSDYYKNKINPVRSTEFEGIIRRYCMFSLYDAIRYYNDIDNLKPELGSVNTSKGADSAQGQIPINTELAKLEVRMENTWIDIKENLKDLMFVKAQNVNPGYFELLTQLSNIMSQALLKIILARKTDSYMSD